MGGARYRGASVEAVIAVASKSSSAFEEERDSVEGQVDSKKEKLFEFVAENLGKRNLERAVKE